MFRALLKKQMAESSTWLTVNKKSGKRRSVAVTVGMGVLWLLLFGMIGGLMFFVGRFIARPFSELELDWLYFAIMGLAAVALGVFGSVFNTYAMLYAAKDNELLLSLPIPPRYILCVKLIGVWLWSLIYEAVVFIPAVIAYIVVASPSVSVVLFAALLMLVLSVFILTLSCVLGWVVAKISAKLKNRAVVTVVLSLIFSVAYYWLYSKAYEILQAMILNAALIGAKIKGYAYPIYIMGKAGAGDALSSLIFTAGVLVIFALVAYLLSHSFIKIATTSVGTAKVKYKAKSERVRSQDSALLRRELRHFTSSSVYMLNCGLGMLLMPVAGIFLLANGGTLRSLCDMLSLPKGLICCAILVMLSGTNDITAPSVSLEGKELWLIRSLPVSTDRILAAKVRLQLVLTLPSLLIASVCLCVAFRLGAVEAVFTVLLPIVYTVFYAMIGLMMNLRFPRLDWKTEMIPVKQSMSVAVVLFGGWGVTVALGVLYYLLRNVVSPTLYLVLCTLMFGISVPILWHRIKTRGAGIFESL